MSGARSRTLPWLVVVLGLVLGYSLLSLARRAAPGTFVPTSSAPAEATGEELAGARPAERASWRGELELEGIARLVASVARYDPRPAVQAFRSERLRARHGLAEGELWRLVLWIEADEEAEVPLALATARVVDRGGEALAALAPPAGTRDDPLLALFELPETVLAPFEPYQVALWGRAPAEDAVLALAVEGGPLELALRPERLERDEIPRWFAHSSGPAGTTGAADPRDARIAELEAELAGERLRRRERELEWLDYNQGLAELDLRVLGAQLGFDIDPAYGSVRDEEPEPEPVDEEEAERRARAQAIQVSLTTLFRLEGLRGMELLNVGSVGDGWVGPVLFRLLDDRGRLVGSISAERLRLEGSRAARTLTLVLEEGYDGAGGERTPFADGLRRIVLPFVDPDPWMESCPELFAERDLDPPNDDGVWHLPTLRRDLNRLLALETSGGWYRLRSLGGVLGEELVEVHLEEFDPEGRIRRRLFADRLRVQIGSSGVMLVLEDGAVVRGDQKEGFRDGTYEIFLPLAPREEWDAARLPGLDEPLAPPDGG